MRRTSRPLLHRADCFLTPLNGLCNPIAELFLRLFCTLLNILALLCGLSLGIFEPRNPGFLCLIYATFQVVNRSLTFRPSPAQPSLPCVLRRIYFVL